MSEALSVLIVSEERGRASRWAAWLARRGFVSLWCVGPQVNEDCPRLDGRTCGRRELFGLTVTGPVTEHELARAMHRIARDPRKPRIPGRKGSAAAPTTPRPPSVRPLV